jgi:hypothetical protein
MSTSETTKKGRKKLEITTLKEIISRLPKSHITPVIALIKEYCVKNELNDCIDEDKERKELEALCEEKGIECPKINEMNLTQVKTMIRSINLGDIKSNIVKAKSVLKSKAPLKTKLKSKPKEEEEEETQEEQEEEQEEQQQQ